ncbi:MAG: ThuA domain-containing protein [Bryobacteraceae bacterium]
MMNRRELLLTLPAAPLLAAAKPHVVFVTGDDEYRSEVTMPMIASILESRCGLRTTTLFAKPTPQTKNDIPGLEALDHADMAVFYLRFRALPENQLGHILKYAESGKPLAGLRTSTHAFLYPKGHPRESLNQDFPRDVFGQIWTRHHGHRSSTDVTVAEDQKDHPILRGVEAKFHVRSWLYHVNPLPPVSTPLLIGRAVNPEKQDWGPNAVAWTKQRKGARVFFTTMGHPEDFTLPSVRRLVVQGILWALDRKIPRHGVNVDSGYAPPSTTPG